MSEPTERQLQKLREFGITRIPSTSKEASALISAATADAEPIDGIKTGKNHPARMTAPRGKTYTGAEIAAMYDRPYP